MQNVRCCLVRLIHLHVSEYCQLTNLSGSLEVVAWKRIINPQLLRVRVRSEGYCSRFVCVCIRCNVLREMLRYERSIHQKNLECKWKVFRKNASFP